MINREALIAGIAGLAAAWIVAVALLSLAWNNANERADRAEQTIERITEHTDSKSGGTSLLTGININYNLRTFDGGKTWYAVEIDRDWGMTILDESNDVYPGLLNHIEAMDKLIEHVKQNGSIGVDDIQLLKDAGFEVKRK